MADMTTNPYSNDADMFDDDLLFMPLDARQKVRQSRKEMAEAEALTAQRWYSRMLRRANSMEMRHQGLSIHGRSHQDASNARKFESSVVRRAAAVLTAEGVNVPIVAVVGPIEGWTNFKSIHVRYPRRASITQQAAELRTLIYHEGGHCRWTIPFTELIAGRNCGASELSSLQRSWNIMEDQRMETAVVSDSPRKAAYFTVLILSTHCENPKMAALNYPLLVWRKYLPKDVRLMARAGYVASHGEQDTVELEQIIDRYVRATSMAEMWQAVLDYTALTRSQAPAPLTPDDSTMRGADIGSNGDFTEKLNIPIDQNMVDDNPAEDEDDNPAEEAEGSAEGLTEAQKQALEQRNADPELLEDERSYNGMDALNSMLPPENLIPALDGDATTEALALADLLMRSFEANTIDKAPTWVNQSRRGVLDVNRYVTRQRGDVEFCREYKEDESPGSNIAVSLLLDRSGSMLASAKELALVGYACKVACDRLNIACTVMLWDDGASVLWDSTERAEFLPIVDTQGSTDPATAFNDLDNQECDKVHHIVMVMTDGGWSGCSVEEYAAPGRSFLGLYYCSRVFKDRWTSEEWEQIQMSGIESMKREGFTDVEAIDDLREIANHLERAILNLV